MPRTLYGMPDRIGPHPFPISSMYFDPPVLLHKSSLMQKLSDYVRLGCTDYITGVVRAERAAPFVRKMTRYYRVDLGADRNHRARSKAAAEGCAILLLGPGNTYSTTNIPLFGGSQGISQEIAVPFTPSGTFTLTQIDVGITSFILPSGVSSGSVICSRRSAVITQMA